MKGYNPRCESRDERALECRIGSQESFSLPSLKCQWCVPTLNRIGKARNSVKTLVLSKQGEERKSGLGWQVQPKHDHFNPLEGVKVRPTDISLCVNSQSISLPSLRPTLAH